MNNDDLKRYSVIVGEGSGCFFQPMTADYTYILTAKHLFFDEEEDERGQTQKKEYPDNTPVTITKNIQTANGWIEEQIPFTLVKGTTYFPHKEADVAILKITPPQTNFDQIVASELLNTSTDYDLCGFPNTLGGNNAGEKYTTHRIERLIASANYSHSAQLFGTLNQVNIEGMSGCGVLKVVGNYISIIGIQSKMASSLYPAGQIGFVPIKHINEIINYNEYRQNLERLYPPFLKSFSFLKNEAFNLNAGFGNQNIEHVKNFLKNKTNEVINSPLTPFGIKNLFENRLLLYKQGNETLQSKYIWLIWLEFLTILNLLREGNLSEESVKDGFNNIRLICSDTDEDWSSELDNIIYSDFKGLKRNGIVIVGCKKPPINDFYILDRKIPMINQAVRSHNRELLQIDSGMNFPLSEYKFIHVEYFKNHAIVSKRAEYAEILDDVTLLDKLKAEYTILSTYE